MKTDEGSEQHAALRAQAAAQGNFAEAGALAPPGDAGPTYASEAVTEHVSLSPFQAGIRRLARDRRAMVSLTIIIVVILVSFIGPNIYTHIGAMLPNGGTSGTTTAPPSYYHNYANQNTIYANTGISGYFPLGTDELGRDILARLMAGVTVSITVAMVVVAFDIVLGMVVGTLAGWYGGWIDTFLARFTDLMFAFPQLLFAILAAATLGGAFQDRFGLSGRLLLVSLALGVTIWPQMARYVRGQTLQLKEQQFIEAARTVGTSNFKIILRHIVPNLFSIVVTAATLDIVGIIIGEATISLLGLGVQPPGSSLGLMISEASPNIDFAPLEVLWPTLMLAILVLCFSFLGDGIGVAFNPRLKD